MKFLKNTATKHSLFLPYGCARCPAAHPARHYKYHTDKFHYTVPMQHKTLFDRSKSYGPREWAQIVFMILIMCAGGYLIIYSVYAMTVNRDPTIFMFSIAMFGVGCTTIWFALSHVEIQSTEEKLEDLTYRLDKIIEKIEKQ